MAVPQIPIKWILLISDAESGSIQACYCSLFQLQVFFAGVKQSRHPERQSQGPSGGVPRGESVEDRKTKVPKDIEDDFLKAVTLVGARSTTKHFSENDPMNVLQLPCQLEVHQHAIDLIRFGIHIFQKENLARSLHFVGGPQSCSQERKTAAGQPSPSHAWLQSFQPRGGDPLPRVDSRQTFQQILPDIRRLPQG